MGKVKKQSYSSLFLMALLMAYGTLVSSCKPNEQKAGTQPPANASRDALKAQSPLGSAKPEVNILAARSKEQEQSLKPKINFVTTEKLYKKISQKKLGASTNTRFISLHHNVGILIHPGVSPTEVTFDVSGMKETLKLVFWVGQFSKESLSIPNAGTAGFKVFVDGKSLGRKRVDRFTNQTLLVDPKGASKLRIVVDDDDGVQTCDWFYMGLQ